MAQPDSDLSPEHSSLYQIFHPGSCLLPYPPPARTCRGVAKRDVAHRGAGGVGSCFLSTFWRMCLGTTGKEDSDQNGDGKGSGLEKEGSCCRLLRNTASSKVVTQSVQQRKLTADSSSCGGGRNEGGIITLRGGGDSVSCRFWNPSLSPPIPPPLHLKTRGERGPDTLGRCTWLSHMASAHTHTHTHTHTLQTSHAPLLLTFMHAHTVSDTFTPI